MTEKTYVEIVTAGRDNIGFETRKHLTSIEEQGYKIKDLKLSTCFEIYDDPNIGGKRDDAGISITTMTIYTGND